MAEAPRRYWDAVGAEWARTEPQALWRRHSDAVNSRLLLRWLGETRPDRLLKTDAFDEAVGEGLLPLLARHAHHVVEVDLGRSVLHQLRARHPGAQGVAGDVRALPFASGCFDAVTSLSTLDHFTSPDEIGASLTEIRRVLGPGGRLLVTLDNPQNPVVALRNVLPFSWLHRIGLVPYYVGATLSARRLHEALREAGFEVEESSAILHAPRVLAVAAAGWIERRRTGPGGERLLRALMACEVLARLPTRRLTGHFVAVLARAREG